MGRLTPVVVLNVRIVAPGVWGVCVKRQPLPAPELCSRRKEPGAAVPAVEAVAQKGSARPVQERRAAPGAALASQCGDGHTPATDAQQYRSH